MPKVGKKSGQAVNLRSKLDRIHETWKPQIIAELNDAYVKLVKVKGEFVWHHHEREDELFLVLKGRLRIELRDGPWTSERASLRSSRAASSIDTRRRGRGPCRPARAADDGEQGADACGRGSRRAPPPSGRGSRPPYRGTHIRRRPAGFRGTSRRRPRASSSGSGPPGPSGTRRSPASAGSGSSGARPPRAR